MPPCLGGLPPPPLAGLQPLPDTAKALERSQAPKRIRQPTRTLVRGAGDMSGVFTKGEYCAVPARCEAAPLLGSPLFGSSTHPQSCGRGWPHRLSTRQPGCAPARTARPARIPRRAPAFVAWVTSCISCMGDTRGSGAKAAGRWAQCTGMHLCLPPTLRPTHWRWKSGMENGHPPDNGHFDKGPPHYQQEPFSCAHLALEIGHGARPARLVGRPARARKRAQPAGAVE